MKYISRIKYILYIFYECIVHKKQVLNTFKKIHIKDNQHTLKYIIENHVSVSRFGDGEFALISGSDTDFQIFNTEIQHKLQLVLSSQENNHITCIPYIWKKPYTIKYDAFEYRASWLCNNLETKVLPHLKRGKTYYDSTFTRFYIDYRNDKNAKMVIPLLKQIWNNQNICFIEGEQSRLGVGNDLFDNAISISRILCPTTNAFYVYDQIIEKVKEQPKDTLFLIALGMTATCLAYDLSQLGYWAIDIGHIDIEYEWYLMKAKKKVAIPNKYVAEISNHYTENNIHNDTYQSQIIAKIS